VHEAQEKVKRFVSDFGLETAPHIRLLDLLSELGEVSKAYLTFTKYGQLEIRKNMDWELELGDVYFSLLCLANVTNVDLEHALEKSLEKYQKRFEAKEQISSS
jgi:NTP pyrophosphatase (non-canonical NTP hydrolase)